MVSACRWSSSPEGRILDRAEPGPARADRSSVAGGGHQAPMAAECSLESDPVLNELGVRTTTDPIQCALWAGSGQVIVFATYASQVDREDFDAPMGRWRPLWQASVRAGDGRLFVHHRGRGPRCGR